MTRATPIRIDEDKLKKLWPLPISTDDLCDRMGIRRHSVYRVARRLNLGPRPEGVNR